MKNFLFLSALFGAALLLFASGPSDAAPLSMDASALTPASLAAGLPPIQKEDRPPGLPPSGQTLQKSPELEPQPLRPADYGLPPDEDMKPVERKRPGLAPLPAPPPSTKETPPVGLPPKEL